MFAVNEKKENIFQSDIIMCLGSYDIRVAEKAASLWHHEMADVILFSGNSGKLTEGKELLVIWVSGRGV